MMLQCILLQKITYHLMSRYSRHYGQNDLVTEICTAKKTRKHNLDLLTLFEDGKKDSTQKMNYGRI